MNTIHKLLKCDHSPFVFADVGLYHKLPQYSTCAAPHGCRCSHLHTSPCECREVAGTSDPKQTLKSQYLEVVNEKTPCCASSTVLMPDLLSFISSPWKRVSWGLHPFRRIIKSSGSILEDPVHWKTSQNICTDTLPIVHKKYPEPIEPIKLIIK